MNYARRENSNTDQNLSMSLHINFETMLRTSPFKPFLYFKHKIVIDWIMNNDFFFK